MKRIVFISVLILAGCMVFGQNTGAQLEFGTSKHDFGKFKEEAGPQTATFEFTNTGTSDLLVTRVLASCGCTTPDWTKQPVKPGEKGFVKVTYDPKNRPNKFKKTATVYTNGQPKVSVLIIEGDVIPRELTMEEIYRWPVGEKLRFKSNHIPFTDIVRGTRGIRVMEIINVSKEDVKLGFERVPAHLQLKTKPEVLKPGEKGIVEAEYDTRLKDDWGYVNDLIRVSVNDSVYNNLYMVVSANLVEDFKSMTKEELDAAPVAEFETTKVDFGDIKQREKVTVSFKYSNTGKSDLVIRKIRTTCGCTTISKSNTVVKPGESSTIEAVFDAGVRQGKQHKMINVITNDPKNSQVNLILSGNVLVSG